MSLGHSPKIVTNGLVFAYDIHNQQKSWKGKPTTNYAYLRNPRVDSSYATYSATALGTWNAKHPEAIRVYNSAGSELSALVNTGVTDWTNTYHAIWTYDAYLRKPVVTMKDYDGQWKAHSFNLGQTMSTMGLSVGSTYTISWLQWTSDIAKSANAGLYGQNTSAVNGFHDGLSNSFGTAYNTIPCKWQRVYATFTVSSSWNLAASLSCYIYGHYIKRGTVKVVDIQIEPGTGSGFLNEFTRSNTQALLDLVGGNTITANSLTYNSDGSFSFNGTDNDLTISGPAASFFTNFTTQQITLETWIKIPTAATWSNGFYGNILSRGSYAGSVGLWRHTTDNQITAYFRQSGATFGAVECLASITRDSWYHLTATWTGSVLTLYVNGVQASTNSGTLGTPTIANWTIGNVTAASGANGNRFQGEVSSTKIYTRALSSSEVLQNFNSQRSRYSV